MDIATDPTFQERFWVVVRIGWLVMAAILVAALLGFTGGGGRFSAQTIEAGSARIEFPAIARWAAADRMTVTVGHPAGPTAITLPEALGEIISIEAVNPQPRSVTARAEGDEYIFDLAPEAGEASIEFSVRPVRPALAHGLEPFRVNGEASRPSSVTVLP